MSATASRGRSARRTRRCSSPTGSSSSRATRPGRWRLARTGRSTRRAATARASTTPTPDRRRPRRRPTIRQAQGGALRSQDIRTSGDPVSLDGSVIRIHPDTGAALPDNPRIADPDANGKRIVAHGLRNPFRFTIRPGTNEVWIGDVGWNTWEEINRILDGSDAIVENFGWPCYEGVGTQSGYQPFGICQAVARESRSRPPYYTYNHSAQVVAGEACPTGSSSIAGLAFYPESGGSYPDAYKGALFFADYSRNCIWAMRKGANGLPDPADRVTIRSGGGGPVNLVSGPGGDIFYPGLQRRPAAPDHLRQRQPSACRRRSGQPDVGHLAAHGQFQRHGIRAILRDRRSRTRGISTGTARSTTRRRRRRHSRMAPADVITVRVRVSDTQGLSDVAAVVISVEQHRAHRGDCGAAGVVHVEGRRRHRLQRRRDGSGAGLAAAVGVDVVGHHAPLPVELPRARHPAVRRRRQRIVHRARSRVPVAPRAPSDGDRQRRSAEHGERARAAAERWR